MSVLVKELIIVYCCRIMPVQCTCRLFLIVVNMCSYAIVSPTTTVNSCGAKRKVNISDRWNINSYNIR